jgi:hypothetical protein
MVMGWSALTLRLGVELGTAGRREAHANLRVVNARLRAVEPWHADDFDATRSLEEKQQLCDGGKLREVARAIAVPREQVLTALIGNLGEQLAICIQHD